MATKPSLPSHWDISQVFTPHAPVDERDLFAGRKQQIGRLIDVVSQRGLHAIMFGERGVGKTSLARMFSQFLAAEATQIVVVHASCDTKDTFNTLWRKVLNDIAIHTRTEPLGFQGEPNLHAGRLSDQLPEEVGPDDVRRALSFVRGIWLIVVVDELDRLPGAVSMQLADTIKMLSDYGSAATLVLVGVADAVTGLIEAHGSVERALVQIQLPRMSSEEVRELVSTGVSRLRMTTTPEALDGIVSLAQGLPHYAHVLALYGLSAAVDDESVSLEKRHLDEALQKALKNVQHSIQSDYTVAVRSPRSENLFALVLLACALAPTDDLGYFAPSSVRRPLSLLRRRRVEIPSFARHLYEFASPLRGNILSRTGRPRSYQYRFANPLVQPYVVMRGLADGLITQTVLERIIIGRRPAKEDALLLDDEVAEVAPADSGV